MNDEMFASQSVLKIRVHMVLSLVVSDGLVPPCDALLRAPTVSQFSLIFSLIAPQRHTVVLLQILL